MTAEYTTRSVCVKVYVTSSVQWKSWKKMCSVSRLPHISKILYNALTFDMINKNGPFDELSACNNFNILKGLTPTRTNRGWNPHTTFYISGWDYTCMSGLVQTSSEATRSWSSSPLIVSRDSFSHQTLARFQAGGA